MLGAGDSCEAAAEATGRAGGLLQQQLDRIEADSPQGGAGRALQGCGTQCVESVAYLSPHASHLREIDAADAQIGVANGKSGMDSKPPVKAITHHCR